MSDRDKNAPPTQQINGEYPANRFAHAPWPLREQGSVHRRGLADEQTRPIGSDTVWPVRGSEQTPNRIPASTIEEQVVALSEVVHFVSCFLPADDSTIVGDVWCVKVNGRRGDSR